MHPRVRGWLYAAFLLAFLAIAPTVVFYTAGFRLNFQTGRIVQTALLSVETLPRGADVWIDQKKMASRTPALVEDILPGERHVRLTKDGYASWEKRLMFKSRETVFATNVILFAEEEARLLKRTLLLPTAVDPTGRRAAAVVSEGSWFEVWALESGSETQTLLARYPKQTPVQNLVWSTDGSFLEIRTGSGRTTQISLVAAATGRAVDPREEVPDLEASSWDAKDGGRFLIQTPRGLFSLPAGGGEATMIGTSAVSASSEGNRFLLTHAVADRTVLSLFDPLTNVSAILAYLPLGSYVFSSSPNGLVLLSDQKQERIVLVNGDGGDAPLLLQTKASLWQWDPSGAPKLLLSDGFDLRIFDAETRTDETITRLSSPIMSLAWHPSGKVALVTQQDKIFAIEFDGRDRRNVVELVSGANLTDVWTDRRGKTMYFFGKIDGVAGLYSRILQK